MGPLLVGGYLAVIHPLADLHTVVIAETGTVDIAGSYSIDRNRIADRRTFHAQSVESGNPAR